eukprot:scaffold97_cov193-Alexandrium_tamarense.AAC.16
MNGGDEKYTDDATAKYATSSSGGYSYESEDGSDEDDNAFSYFARAAQAVDRNTSSLSMTPRGDSSASSPYPGEETIVFYHGDCSETGSSVSRRSNQEYYDVLEMASDRLKQTNRQYDKLEYQRQSSSSGDEAVLFRKKKKKKKSKRHGKQSTKHKKSKPKSSRSGGDNVESPNELTQREMLNYSIDDEDENGIDPNDEFVPMSARSVSIWSPAALVNAAHSNKQDGKLDRDGFYKQRNNGSTKRANVRSTGAGIIYEKLHQLIRGRSEEIPNDFNLQSIGKQPTEEYLDKSTQNNRALDRCDSIVWGDESITDRDDGIEMVDDCSYSHVNDVSRKYRQANHIIVEKILWRRDRRRLLIILFVGSILFVTCLTLYVKSGNSNTKESRHSNSSATSSASFNRARVAQRYVLAILYYSTNGDEWKNSTDWLNGHECNWKGVGCASDGEAGVMSLTYLDLSNNLLNGTIPSEIGYISSLTQASCPYSSKLQLWGNNLFGSIPSSFSLLVNLRTLYLDKCQLSGDIYDKVEKLRRLQHLDLSFNKLRGKIPHGMGGISSLLDLRLSHNHFSGAFPISLASLPHLQTLLLDNNALGGSLPTNVGKMPSLVTLRIHENDFMGRLPDFTDAVYLEEAHFDENYFLGNIPTFGSNRLRSLYLGRNEFTGSLPESIGRISKLEDLYVQRNKLNGRIPSSISKLTALENIDLSFNKLSGSIPDAISGLMQLRELVLNDNRLTGGLPDIGKIKRLEIARLNNNLLSGNLELSLSVGSLNYLTEFAIQNNDLKGVVPEFVCDLLLDVLASDCWGKSSPVDCPCCTQCF